MGSVITLAFDSFKGSIGAVTLGAALQSHLCESFPGFEIVNFPCSDGGDGFAESVGHHFDTQLAPCTVSGPLLRPITARYVWAPADRLAIIESAQANGLPLLSEEERDPLRTTTYGVGELLLDAVRRGAERIIIGVGGSATVDGGVGMAQALGFTFVDGAGAPLGPKIGEFGDVDEVIGPPDHPLCGVAVSVACDVRTRLLGPRATSAVWIYGPQKGGTEQSLGLIEQRLARLDARIEATLGRDYGSVEMGGAAGGLAAGLAVFAGAELRQGMQLFDELTGLREQVARSDLVITGEGRLDAQSAEGKVADYVSGLCRELGVPVFALCGSAEGDPLPLDGIIALTDSGMPAEDCIARPLDALDHVMPRLVEVVKDRL